MKKLITLMLCITLFAATTNAATYYVNTSLTTGLNDGSSWDNAYQTWSAATTAGSPGIVTFSRSGNAYVTSSGASWTTGSTTITLSVANSNIALNDNISGTGIASSTTVSGINGTTLTLSKATTATVTAGFMADAVADDIYIKGTIPSQSSLWVMGLLDNFYGSFAGTETTPSERPINDNDGNGIIEPWEFLYPTTFTSTVNGTAINGSSAILDGFTITHTGAVNSGTNMTTLLSPIGQTVQNCVFTGSNLSYGATTAYTNANGGCLLKVLGTFKNNLIEKNNVSITYVTSGTSTNDLKLTPILEVNFPATNNVVVSVSRCIFRNNKATITNNGTTGVVDNLRGMVLTTNHPNTAGLTGTSATFSDCIVHNNEFSYSGSTITIAPKGSIASSQVLSSSSSYDYFINCTFANNKTTNMTTCFYATSSGNVVHKVYNNVLCNNQNTVSSTSTTSSVSMVSQSAQNVNSLFSNNYVDVTKSGTWDNGTTIIWNATTNQTNLSKSNTGSNAPYFKKPPMNGTTIVIGANQTEGNADYIAITKADWRLNPGSFLMGKGMTTTVLKDKAGNDFASSPASPSVGAYEYVKITPVISWSQDLTGLNTNSNPLTVTIAGTTTADATLGSPIVYTPTDEGFVSIAGNVLTIVAKGSTTLTASQAANTWYNAATPVVQNVSVTDIPTSVITPENNAKAFTLTSSGLLSKVEGNLQVISLSGQLLHAVKVAGGQFIPLAHGIYILRFTTRTGISSHKVVI